MAAAGTFIDPLIKAITDGNLGMVNTLFLRFKPLIKLNGKKLTKEGSEDPEDLKTPLKHAIDEYISDRTDKRFNRLEIVKKLVFSEAQMDEDENDEILKKYKKNEYNDNIQLQNLLNTYFTSMVHHFENAKRKFSGKIMDDVIPYSDKGAGGGDTDEESARENKLPKPNIPPSPDLSGGRGKIKKKTRKSKRSKRYKRFKASKRSRRYRKK